MQIIKKNTTFYRREGENKLKQLSADQTRRYLSQALNGKDVTMFSTVRVDQREAAKFIERQAKILRFVSISAGLAPITSLVEQIFYEAFDKPARVNELDVKASNVD